MGKKQEELEFHIQIQNDGITGLNCQVTEQLESWDLVMDGSTKAQAEKGWEGCPFCEGTVGMHGTLMCEGFGSI